MRLLKNLLMNFIRYILATFTVALFTLSGGICPPDTAQAQQNQRPAISLSRQQPVALILPATPTAPEETAAGELKNYLAKITGATASILREPAPNARGSRVYIGSTQFAANHLKNKPALSEEEWINANVGGNLLLVGGGSRGTLYAAYHFLEDVCGVRWWTINEETVPHRDRITVKNLYRRSKPAFAYRDVFRDPWNGAVRDDGRFAARTRRNREGEHPLVARYGGSHDYGPPAFTHTVHMFINPGAYYATHPEWFALVKGKRTQLDGQLDYTNAAMRDEFARLLLATIRKAHADAKAANLPLPTIFSVSQADNNNWCECEKCAALVAREGSQAGPMIDFVNDMAGRVSREFPQVSLLTLAYALSEDPPRTIRPRDNVIIHLTDTRSNLLLPITAPRNYIFHNNLTRWAAISKSIRIWDYNETYGMRGLPMPTVNTYADDLRFYQAHNVEGVFAQMEEPVRSDMRDMKVWVLSKLLEDPQQDYRQLVRTFTNGYYGPAARPIRDYLALMETTVIEHSKTTGTPDVSWYAGLQQHSYLTLNFTRKAQAIFDRATKAVEKDPILLRRVQAARMPLDRATVANYEHLLRAWINGGRTLQSMPLSRPAILNRYMQAWEQEIERNIDDAHRFKYRSELVEERKLIEAMPLTVPIPEKFKNVKPADLYAYTALDARSAKVRDAASPNGIASYRELSPAEAAELPWGVYDQFKPATTHSGTLPAKEIRGPGYHLYKLATITLTPNCEVYMLGMEVDFGNAYDQRQPEQKFDLWVNLKLQGPAFSHGKAEEKNAVFWSHVYLVKQPKTTQSP